MPSYPSKLLFTALQCFLSAMQSFVVAIAVERNLAKWRLGWDMGLVAVVYCVSIYIYMVNTPVHPLKVGVPGTHLTYDTPNYWCYYLDEFLPNC
ncbi:hypothetical protein LINPERHAP1_LOCUS32314 [Linum perenne]